jgi:hypothetical protein
MKNSWLAHYLENVGLVFTLIQLDVSFLVVLEIIKVYLYMAG